MSNALAIAAVTAVMKDLLNNGLIDHDVSAAVSSSVAVSVMSPQRVITGENEQAQLNLFLYEVARNPSWQNATFPSRDHLGDRVTNPPLALDLRYLLSAYGKQDFDGEILLGYAMQILHENPILPRDAIRTALGPGPGGAPVSGSLLPTGPLAASELAEQVEQIKISPQNLSTEELSKLWTALQAPWRPAAGYQVSVVLIESKRPRKSALPVRRPQIYVQPFVQLQIERVSSAAPAHADPRITLASTLVIQGRELAGAITLVRLGELELAPPLLEISNSRISFPLAGLTLRAGVQSVQVIHQIPMGEPEQPHRGFESNAAAFLLHPAISIADVSSAEIGVTFVPEVGRAQRVTLVLNQINGLSAEPPRSHTFPAPPNNGIIDPLQPATATIHFPISHVLPGEYLVRAQVDGAESLLLTNTAGDFAAPKLTIA